MGPKPSLHSIYPGLEPGTSWWQHTVQRWTSSVVRCAIQLRQQTPLMTWAKKTCDAYFETTFSDFQSTHAAKSANNTNSKFHPEGSGNPEPSLQWSLHLCGNSTWTTMISLHQLELLWCSNVINAHTAYLIHESISKNWTFSFMLSGRELLGHPCRTVSCVGIL